MLSTSLAALSVVCAASGALFAAASRMWETGAVYFWEAIGSAAGGVFAMVLLMGRHNAVEMASILALLNLGAAITLVGHTRVALLATMLGLWSLGK